MFPEYCKDYSAENIFGNNGYERIPAYRKIEVILPDDMKILVNTIKSLGENSCGFIYNSVVNYHLCDPDSYLINMDNNFVFAYFKDVMFDNIIPSMMLLDFLKFRTNKLLLIFEDTFFLLQKTEETYKVCEKLDEIFLSSSFMRNVFIKSIGEDNYENIFYKLMEIYSMKYLSRDIRKYNFFDILLKILKFDIQ